MRKPCRDRRVSSVSGERSGQKQKKTYRLERRDLLLAVRVKVLLRVVDGHAAVDAVGQGGVLHDLDALVRAVLGALEEHDGRPVVGEVLGEGARGAAAALADIALHGGVEGVAAHDLVEMGRRDGAGLDQRVQTLDRQRRAAEAEGGLGRAREREGERERLHLGDLDQAVEAACGGMSQRRWEARAKDSLEGERDTYSAIYITSLLAVNRFGTTIRGGMWMEAREKP